MTYNMDEEEYKTYISSIINRLIDEKFIYPKIKTYHNSNKIKIKIIFNPPEWYNELDDDTKYNVKYNLQNFYTPNILKTIQDFININKTNDEENVETFNSTSKRLKVE